MQVQIAGSQNIVSKREFDALDRLVGSTSYAKTMALPDFGKATLDSATTATASAEDRTTRFVYDAVGRQRFAVGADGPKFASRPAGPSACGSCGDPRGPGACSMN